MLRARDLEAVRLRDLDRTRHHRDEVHRCDPEALAHGLRVGVHRGELARHVLISLPIERALRPGDRILRAEDLDVRAAEIVRELLDPVDRGAGRVPPRPLLRGELLVMGSDEGVRFLLRDPGELHGVVVVPALEVRLRVHEDPVRLVGV